eukprot:597600-Hanusia_phi.AAC.1
MAFLSVTDSELFDQTYEAVVETSESAQTVQEFFNADLSTPALRCITPNPLEQDAWDELHDDPETKSGIIVKESTAEMQDAPSKTHDDTFTMKVAGAAVKREYESEIQFHSAMSDTKEPWVRIIPRRGNALENRPVVITLEVLSKHFHESIEMAAKKIVSENEYVLACSSDT